MKKYFSLVSVVILVAVLLSVGTVYAAASPSSHFTIPAFFANLWQNSKHTASVTPKHSSVLGTVSNVDNTAHTFTLTAKDGTVYSVSLTDFLAKQVQKEAKAIAQLKILESKLGSKHDLSTKPDRHQFSVSSLTNGTDVVVTIDGIISGTSLSPINLHTLIKHEHSTSDRPVHNIPPKAPSN